MGLGNLNLEFEGPTWRRFLKGFESGPCFKSKARFEMEFSLKIRSFLKPETGFELRPRRLKIDFGIAEKFSESPDLPPVIPDDKVPCSMRIDDLWCELK